MRLIQFKANRGGEPVYVNPDQVVTVRAIPKRRKPSERYNGEKEEAKFLASLPEMTRISLRAADYEVTGVDDDGTRGSFYVDVVASSIEVVQRLTKSEMPQ